MKSIKITKGELRQLIRESVKEELITETFLTEGSGESHIIGKILEIIKNFLIKNPELAKKIAEGGINLVRKQIDKIISRGEAQGGAEGGAEDGSITEGRILTGLSALLPRSQSTHVVQAGHAIAKLLSGSPDSVLSLIKPQLLGPLGDALSDKATDIIEIAKEAQAKGELSESIKKDVRLVLRHCR